MFHINYKEYFYSGKKLLTGDFKCVIKTINAAKDIINKKIIFKNPIFLSM